jgi:hypothetical protein
MVHIGHCLLCNFVIVAVPPSLPLPISLWCLGSQCFILIRTRQEFLWIQHRPVSQSVSLSVRQSVSPSVSPQQQQQQKKFSYCPPLVFLTIFRSFETIPMVQWNYLVGPVGPTLGSYVSRAVCLSVSLSVHKKFSYFLSLVFFCFFATS